MSAQADFNLTFELRAPKRLPALKKMIEALAEIKRLQYSDTDSASDSNSPTYEPDDPHWQTFLDHEARSHFETAFDYNSAEGKTYSALWDLTHFSRRNDPIFNLPGPWDFVSIIAAIHSAEYEIEGTKRVDEAHMDLLYTPHAGPFGGTEALVELIEGFGQYVIYDSWHDGPHLRTEVGWDYERANRLVAEGKGVD